MEDRSEILQSRINVRITFPQSHISEHAALIQPYAPSSFGKASVSFMQQRQGRSIPSGRRSSAHHPIIRAIYAEPPGLEHYHSHADGFALFRETIAMTNIGAHRVSSPHSSFSKSVMGLELQMTTI